MANNPGLVQQLIEALQCLPGVGPKSATRMAFHLLERGRDNGSKLADTLAKAMAQVGHCQRCRTFTEEVICQLCNNTKRDESLLCIVESPSDVSAIEHISPYKGFYFVLMGHLSPIDGIGPSDLGIELLKKRLAMGKITEIILATNATVEGEATAHYISTLAKQFKIKTSRLAYGIPMGGELDLIDGHTLAHAFSARTLYEDA